MNGKKAMVLIHELHMILRMNQDQTLEILERHSRTVQNTSQKWFAFNHLAKVGQPVWSTQQL